MRRQMLVPTIAATAALTLVVLPALYRWLHGRRHAPAAG